LISVKGKPGLQTVALGLGTCCHHRQIVVTVSLHTSLRMMEYAAPPGAFSSLKSALAKEDICRHRPTNQKAEKEKRQNEIAEPDCNILTTSNPQNKLVYRTTRYVYISDLMCITGG
jgi:hypothetical protein